MATFDANLLSENKKCSVNTRIQLIKEKLIAQEKRVSNLQVAHKSIQEQFASIYKTLEKMKERDDYDASMDEKLTTVKALFLEQQELYAGNYEYTIERNRDCSTVAKKIIALVKDHGTDTK